MCLKLHIVCEIGSRECLNQSLVLDVLLLIIVVQIILSRSIGTVGCTGSSYTSTS